MAEQTQNLGLYTWSIPKTDTFDTAQLANNWIVVDNHDHTPGRGAPLSSASIPPGIIGTAQLANNAVTAPKLAPGAVGTSQLADGSVTTSKIVPGSVTGPLIAPGAVTVDKLDPGIVPLGAVQLWYSPNSGAVPGGFWEPMDGRAWSGIVNTLGTAGTPLVVGNIPDTRNLFVLGAGVNGIGAAAMGVGGGSSSASIAHSHGVNAHVHTAFGHSHGVLSDGSHAHTFQGGLTLHSRTNAFLSGLTITDTSTYARQNLLQSVYLGGFNAGASDPVDNSFGMDASGYHNHTGGVVSSPDTVTSAAGSTTDSQLGSVSLVPSNVALLYIMRVR